MAISFSLISLSNSLFLFLYFELNDLWNHWLLENKTNQSREYADRRNDINWLLSHLSDEWTEYRHYSGWDIGSSKHSGGVLRQEVLIVAIVRQRERHSERCSHKDDAKGNNQIMTREYKVKS
jgi:hypothetical protein